MERFKNKAYDFNQTLFCNATEPLKSKQEQQK